MIYHQIGQKYPNTFSEPFIHMLVYRETNRAYIKKNERLGKMVKVPEIEPAAYITTIALLQLCSRLYKVEVLLNESL